AVGVEKFVNRRTIDAGGWDRNTDSVNHDHCQSKKYAFSKLRWNGNSRLCHCLTTSTLPPAFSMAALAVSLNLCAFTVSAFFKVPLPRIFTGPRVIHPCAFNVSGVTSPDNFSSDERLMISYRLANIVFLKPNFGKRR